MLVTREKMIDWLNGPRKVDAIGRACVVLMERQTNGEKAELRTKETNNKGFTQADARSGVITARYYLKYGTLEEWQIKLWSKRNVNGIPRIAKYWAQLNEEAIEKQRKNIKGI